MSVILYLNKAKTTTMRQQVKIQRVRFQEEIIEGGIDSNNDNSLRVCPYTGQIFKPTNPKQKFISEDARIKYNNGLRSKKDREKNALLEKIYNNDRVLERGFNQLVKTGKTTIGKDALEFSGYDFSASTSVTTNQVTGQQIIWAVNYGIEESKGEKHVYIIVKK
jgi:hypothetical protein